MTDPPPRLLALDGLRGLAVMGILLMNLLSFAMPAPAYLDPAAYGTLGLADIGVWAACFVLADGKLRALFSFLFGASLLLVVARAEANGADPAAVHFRRMAVLFGIGLAHAYLVWSGDILMLYATAGALAFAFAGHSARTLVVIGVGLIAAQLLLLVPLLGDLAALREAALAPHATPAALAAWRGVADQIGPPSPGALAHALATYRGGYAGILHERLTVEAATPFLQFIDAGPETLGLMLLGMAGLRSGFVAGAWRPALYGRIAIGCYMVGVPPLAWIAWRGIAGGFDPIFLVHASELYGAPFRPVLMIGHAAAALWWIGSGHGRAAVVRVAAVGRAALSNYLGTSIVMTTLFYGYGAGLYGRFNRAELILIAPLAWAAMLGWSAPWLRRYRYGPFEWLWRSLARGAWQPIRQAIAS